MVLVIATALNKEGICAVLTGDAAAAMHLRGITPGPRLNYSLTSPATASRLASAIRHLGFEPVEGGHYRHAEAGVALELTQEPLAVGRDSKVVAQTLQLRHGFVRILSPTDCCREQLLLSHAAGSDDGMNKAVELAKRCDVKMPDMRTWMRQQGMLALWSGFKRAVEGTARQAAAPAPPAPRAIRLR